MTGQSKNRPIKIVAKNFRGFREISLNILDANFIVGDNSSGKTSLLYLIDTVSMATRLPNFAISSGKRIRDSEDLLSPYINEDTVTIGYFGSGIVDSLEQSSGRLITYRASDRNLLPQIVSYVSGGEVMTLRESDGRLLKAISTIDKNSSTRMLLECHLNENLDFHNVSEIPDELLKSDLKWIFASAELEENKFTLKFELGSEGRLLRFSYFGPNRIAPAKYYDPIRKLDDQGSHIPHRLARMVMERTPRAKRLVSIVNRFGKSSGLFDSIQAVPFDENDQNSPIKIMINRGGKLFGIDRVGYGVSQILPIIIDCAYYSLSEQDAVLLIQQPELHLHPRAQAAFGELAWRLCSRSLRFVIETHSDYVIDRFRYCQYKGANKKEAQIIFCSNDKDGNEMVEIGIDDHGKAISPPKGYRSFFLKEQDNLFDML